jgi:hypothetical protein
VHDTLQEVVVPHRLFHLRDFSRRIGGAAIARHVFRQQ